ncbi:MAG: hypothetical protein VX133_08990 [Pseudomonadota bacterium]|nr:hypothetical protein [Pseudomonadota bacterium]
MPDNRSILRVQIRNALRSIVEDEKREAAMHQRQMDKESTLMKGLIYTGAFMTGIGSSAWGLAVQAKEISDVINPFVKMQHHATALRTAWESDDFADTYTETYLSGEKRELVEAIGFDPSQITQQQIDEAIAMADLVLNDDSLRDILYGFVKDYAEAQHAIEITRVAGSGAFELILTIIVAAVTGGAGVVAAVGSKMHLVRKFKGVGEHLVEFAKASRSIKKAKKESQGQNTGPGKFESEAGSAKQTNPHGAETGEVSKPKNTANAVVPENVPMTQEKFDEIINLENGNRPDNPAEYLPEEYISEHLAKFENEGAGIIVIEDWISNPKYKTLSPDGKFVGLGSEMDILIEKYKVSGGDWKILRDGLNLGENVMLEDSRIAYVKTKPKDPRFEYSIPTGNEGGAYEGEWIPGGYTKAGTAEATMSGGEHIVHNNNIDNLSKIDNIYVEKLQ